MFGKKGDDLLNSYTDILIEFFELAVYNVLYTRELYPANSFVRKKHYGIPVQVSIHPDVRKYVFNIMSAAKQLMEKNEFKKLSINILSGDSQIIERHFLHLARFNDPIKTDDMYFTQLESSLRSLHLKQSTSLGNLKSLPKDSRFSVHLHTTEMGTSLLEDDTKPQDFPFVLVPEDEIRMCTPGILPISTVSLDNARLALYSVYEEK
ncbi:mitotic spindle assembly checkpoint protein MAD2B [Ischnura elegans]|uniref:mitotic spindle assembly checkpoint protein MAD2B n=1 Tax=Ischnura elegans TaxID=197161 RepID=UPI001ED8A31D|nr:mitotic spindle assembly checkpoint protein MAD2B [Ischnura elegans]